MKILNVHQIESGIDNAINDMDSFYDQISPIQRAVRAFYGLDDALKGKGAEAIRSFFNEVHQPFLISLYQSMVDYEHILKELKDTMNSFESNANGFIRQDFLEEEVTNGFAKVMETTEGLTDDTNEIINSVSDLVSIKNIDSSEVLENAEEGKREVKKTVEELHMFDKHGSSILEQAKEDVRRMRTYLSDMESKLNNGDLTVTTFSVDEIKGMDSYKLLIDGITNRKDAEDLTLDETTIQNMPLSIIEEQKNEMSKTLNGNGKVILNQAFLDLKNGNIDREQYVMIASELQKLDKDRGFDELKRSIDPSSDNKIDDLMRDYTSLLLAVAEGPPFKISSLYQATLSALDFVTGMYEDLNEKAKTVGEAIVDNGVETGLLSGTNGIVVAGVGAGVGGVFGGTTVAGAIAGIGIGVLAATAVTTTFDYMYDNNTWGTQEKLDKAGHTIDDALEQSDDAMEEYGDALLDSQNAYNPIDAGEFMFESSKDAMEEHGEALLDSQNAYNPIPAIEFVGESIKATLEEQGEMMLNGQDVHGLTN